MVDISNPFPQKKSPRIFEFPGVESSVEVFIANRVGLPILGLFHSEVFSSDKEPL